MILYRKGAPLRIRRSASPEPPFWAATTVAPYSSRRSAPLSIDYLTMRATAADRVETGICDTVRDELERMRTPAPPILIDAAEAAELVFRRGEETLAFCEENLVPALQLISTRSTLPGGTYPHAMIAVAAWPPDPPRLHELFAEAARRELRWGVVVPVVYPVTTELTTLEWLADAAKTHGARFLAAINIDSDPTARQALAQSLNLDHEDDRYAVLFHGAVEPVQLATERHAAALAHERGMLDFVEPPAWEERTNWNAAVLLTLTASRMMAMELDLDLAGLIGRSARAVAELDKPLERIAESASLSIIGALDGVSVDILTEWLDAGEAQFVDYVNEQWRLRRDVR